MEVCLAPLETPAQRGSEQLVGEVLVTDVYQHPVHGHQGESDASSSDQPIHYGFLTFLVPSTNPSHHPASWPLFQPVAYRNRHIAASINSANAMNGIAVSITHLLLQVPILT